MAAIDFPNSPSINDQFTAAGITWIWTGDVWNIVSSVNNQGIVDVGFGADFDGQGGVVLVNTRKYFVVPRACTITGWSIAAEGTSPTCTLDVWKIASGTALPTVANTIMGTKPALSTGNVIISTTLTAWTVTGAANDIWCVNVDACANATKISFLLNVTWS